MVSFRFLAAIAKMAAMSGVFAVAFPSSSGVISGNGLLGRRSTRNSNGKHDGFFYSFWTDGLGTVNYENGDDGAYRVSWVNCGNFVGGKGWTPGTRDRNITYSGTFRPEGNGYLSVYGFSRDPLVEYYVVESHGSYNPSQQFARNASNSLQVDGGTYTFGKNTLVRMALGPDAILHQVWSVRDPSERRVAGTVSMKVHFDAWEKKLGVKFGTLQYQIVATEGYRSSGMSEIQVERSA